MKHLVLLLSFFVFSNHAFSQFGLKAGLTHSFISLGSEDIGWSSHETEFNPGLTAGVFGKLWLGDVIFLNPELNFYQTGSKGPLNALGIELGSQTALTSFVNLGTSIGYQLGDVLSLSIGGGYGYLLAHKITISDVPENSFFSENGTTIYTGSDIDDDLLDDGRTRYAANVTAGFGLNFESLIVDLRYQRNLIMGYYDTLFEDVQHTILLTVGVMFGY